MSRDTHSESVEPGVDGATLVDLGRKSRAQRREARSVVARAIATWRGLSRPARLGLLAAGLALVFGSLIIAVGAELMHERIYPRVYVHDLSVGMLTAQEAARAIEEHFEVRIKEPVIVTHDSREWQVEGARLGVTLDVEAIVDEVMRVGRAEGFTARLIERFQALVTPVVVPAHVAVDSAELVVVVEELAAEIDRVPSDAYVHIDGTEARLEPSVPGVQVRRDLLSEEITAAFSAIDRVVKPVVNVIPVRVADADARSALAHARSFLSADAIIRHGSTEWAFTPAELAEWIDFRTTPVASSLTTPGVDPAMAKPATPPSAPSGVPPTAAASMRYRLEAFISPERAREAILRRTGNVVAREPVNARFRVDGRRVTVVPSQDGTGPDIGLVSTELTRVLSRSATRVVELQMQRIEPDLTTEEAQAMGIRERIATFTTRFSAGNRPRVHNIHTLGGILDDTLIRPGEVFSFNEASGPRTAARGYRKAPAIIGGRLVPTLGGGICQVATTIFNTVFESGLPVVERRSHSLFFAVYPAGRDATVAWGGPDFKFRNSTEHYLLIDVTYTNSSITVSLFGTDPGYEVTSRTGPFTDIVAYPVREVEDPALAQGERVVIDEGTTGRRVVVTRRVMSGSTLVREDTFVSRYRPKEELVHVGPRASNVATPTPSSTPTLTP